MYVLLFVFQSNWSAQSSLPRSCVRTWIWTRSTSCRRSLLRSASRSRPSPQCRRRSRDSSTNASYSRLPPNNLLLPSGVYAQWKCYLSWSIIRAPSQLFLNIATRTRDSFPNAPNRKVVTKAGCEHNWQNNSRADEWVNRIASEA